MSTETHDPKDPVFDPNRPWTAVLVPDRVKTWIITCPCGVTVTHPLNGLPETDTPHPCGNPRHWTVRYEEV